MGTQKHWLWQEIAAWLQHRALGSHADLGLCLQPCRRNFSLPSSLEDGGGRGVQPGQHFHPTTHCFPAGGEAGTWKKCKGETWAPAELWEPSQPHRPTFRTHCTVLTFDHRTGIYQSSVLRSGAAVLPSWFPPAVPTCLSCRAASRQHHSFKPLGKPSQSAFHVAKPSSSHRAQHEPSSIRALWLRQRHDCMATVPAENPIAGLCSHPPSASCLRDSPPLFLGSSCLPASEGRWVVGRIPQAVVLRGGLF